MPEPDDHKRQQHVAPIGLPAGGADVVALLRRVVKEHNLAEFQQLNAALAAGESLNEQQKALLQIVHELTDQQQLAERDPRLIVRDGLTDAQRQRMQPGRVDNKPFNYSEKSLGREDVSTLSAKQRELLQVVAENLRDPHLFAEHDGTLEREGLNLSQEEIWMLTEVARARSLEEHQQEFVRKDHRLANQDETLLPRPGLAMEESAVMAPDLPEPDAIPTPKVAPEDYRSLVPDKVKPVGRPEGFKGLIGQTRSAAFKLLGYEPEDDGSVRAPRLWKLVGAGVLFLLCLAVYTVPSLIMQSDPSCNRVAAAQSMHETLAYDDDYSSLRQAEAGREGGGGVQGSTSGGNGATTSGAYQPESRSAGDLLFQARQLAAQYRPDEAAGVYEAYLKQNQSDVDARIELIRVYVQLKRQYLIRKHCIRALKYQPNPEQTKEIMRLFEQS